MKRASTLTPQSPNRSWRLVIRPRSKWLDLQLADLWRYRDLVALFVRRDFVSEFKQTVLGPTWFILQPLLTTLVFVVVFGRMVGLSTDGLPGMLFYLSGNVVWMYFSNVLTATANTFVANANLFGKVYFPRLAVPLSLTISHLLKFALHLVFFAVCWGFFSLQGQSIYMTALAWLVPFLVITMAGLALGLGIIFSALTTKYRDLRFLLEFGVRLLMYGTPVIYPLSVIPEKWRWVMLANPVTPLVEAFRLAFLGQGTVTAAHLAYSAAFALVALLGGAVIFHRVERTFMDTV